MSSDQIDEWVAYSEVEPFGSWVNDYYVAQICTVLSNIVKAIFRKKDSTPEWSTIPEYLPFWNDLYLKPKTEPQAQSVDEMKKFLMGFAKVQNNKFKKVDNKRPPKKKARQ